MRRSPSRQRSGESGAALILVMMVMMTLLGLGITAMWMTSGNLQVSANMNQRTQALYAAEAGLEAARAFLNGPAPPNLDDLLNPGFNPHAFDEIPTGLFPAGHPRQFLPNGVGKVLHNGVVHLVNVQFPDATFSRNTETNVEEPVMMGRYSVWVRNDTAESRMGMHTDDSNGSLVFRSQGVAADGRTTVVLEVTLSPTTLFSTAPGAAASAPVLCASGKNACDDNSSVIYGVVVQ